MQNVAEHPDGPHPAAHKATAMEQMLTGDAMSGIEAARVGFANRAYPIDELEERVLEIAQRITTIPTDIVQINKRTVRRAMDNMGMRASIRDSMPSTFTNPSRNSYWSPPRINVPPRPRSAAGSPLTANNSPKAT